MNRSPTELAYFAGYIDGDGCFSVRQSNRKRGTKFSSSLIINTVNEQNASWFNKHFGGKIIFCSSFRFGHKPVYRYVLNSKDIESYGFEKYLIQKADEFKLFCSFKNEKSKKRKSELVEEVKLFKKNHGVIKTSLKNELESIRNTKSPILEDFAYLAGFIDAECCLGIQRNFPKNRPNPTYKIQLQLNDTKFPCLYWLSERFGGQFHFIDRNQYKSFHNNQMTWRLSAAQLIPILPKVLPFLNHKKPVCEALIKFYETNIIRQGSPSPNSANFAEFYRPVLEERAKIFDHITSLNKKGI